MEYTVKEFREKTREVFNKAENGDSVHIVRYGKLFKLELGGVQGTVAKIKKIIDKPEKDIIENAKEVFGINEPIINILKQGSGGRYNGDSPIAVKELEPPKKVGTNLCKIHGIPLTTMGKCLQKGCKYA